MSDETPPNGKTPMQIAESGPGPPVGGDRGRSVVIHPEKDGLIPVTMRLWYFAPNDAAPIRDSGFLHRIRQRWHSPKCQKLPRHDNIGGK